MLKVARNFLLLGLAACTVEGPSTSEPASKIDAAALAGKDDTTDWCERFDWYGDAECDTFCARPDPDCGRPRLCAAIRGNGTYIFSHWGSLARIVEEYGEIDGVAGGSSASITSFLYESMVMSPSLEGRTPEERRERLALMLKSLMGYAELLGQSEEAQAFVAAARLASEISESGSASPGDAVAVARRLRAIVAKPEYRAVVNPRIVATLSNRDGVDAATYARNVQEIVTAARTAQDFSAYAQDQHIFFRDGLVSFAGLSVLLARIGELYAGAEPESAELLESFLQSCGPHSAGKTWAELTAEQPEACALPFRAAYEHYHHAIDDGFRPAQSRLDQLVGGRIPAFIATAFLSNEHGTLDAWLASDQRYRRGEALDFHPDFRDVKFGYFVPRAFGGIDTVLREENAGDAKAEHAEVLNRGRGVTWRTALTYSPMEPGLSAILPVDEDGDSVPDRGYIGGWADLHPVQVLRAAGCDEVIYVSRAGAESGFITLARSLENVPDEQRSGVAELLGLTAADQRALYTADDPDSSFSRAIASSTAVWCTDWNSAREGEVEYMFGQSYGSIASHDTLFDGSPNPYAGHMTGLALNSGQSVAGTLGSGAIPVITSSIVGCRP